MPILIVLIYVKVCENCLNSGFLLPRQFWGFGGLFLHWEGRSTRRLKAVYFAETWVDLCVIVQCGLCERLKKKPSQRKMRKSLRRRNVKYSRHAWTLDARQLGHRSSCTLANPPNFDILLPSVRKSDRRLDIFGSSWYTIWGDWDPLQASANQFPISCNQPFKSRWSGRLPWNVGVDLICALFERRSPQPVKIHVQPDVQKTVIVRLKFSGRPGVLFGWVPSAHQISDID